MKRPSASFTFVIRAKLKNEVGILGKVFSAIGETGGDVGAVDIVEVVKGHVIRDITIRVRDDRHCNDIISSLNKLDYMNIVNVSDRTFLMHLGGKIEIKNRIPLTTRADLSMAYTPGVARVCTAIHEDKSKAYNLTIKKNNVMIVTDGTAVLGLGNIGPEAAMPVMEGKAMLFKEFGQVDAYPICLNTTDPDEIVNVVKAISPGFGGVNLEDIAAPRCFEIEERLKDELDIPVFHDDQHGTAIVALAALFNALKIVGKKIKSLKIVISGAGAAGIACAKLFMAAGATNIIGCDREGAIYRGRKKDMNPMKEWFADNSNPHNEKGSLKDVIKEADFFLGVSAPGLLDRSDIENMAQDAIVFALSNPDPEVAPEDIEGVARIIATGRSDYINQINNVLCFPGIFRGLLDSRAKGINLEMKIAAAKAIASIISEKELCEEYIIPSVFNKKVSPAVATAVAKEAKKSGMARRKNNVSII